jgi:hypothetical protein
VERNADDLMSGISDGRAPDDGSPDDVGWIVPTASNLLPANPDARMKRNQPKTSRGRGMQVWEWDELRRFLEVSDQLAGCHV